MTDLVGYELDAGAARITLSAPERGNPLDPAMAADLLRAVRRARADDARVVVLRGRGRAFSFGGDVGAFATAEDPEQLVDDLAEGDDAARVRAETLQLVLAAMGDALLGGAMAKALGVPRESARELATQALVASRLQAG